MEFIDFLLHFLKDPLTVITQLIDQYNTLIYFILFLVVFVETGFVIMPLLPGDSMLFAIGVIAATTGKLSLVIIIPLLILAALLGDNLNYFVGHKFGELIKEKKKILFLKREYIENRRFLRKKWWKSSYYGSFCTDCKNNCTFCGWSRKYEIQKLYHQLYFRRYSLGCGNYTYGLFLRTI